MTDLHTRVMKQLRTSPELRHEGKWRNLYFSKDGLAIFGSLRFDNEQDADLAIKSAELWIAECPETCLYNGNKLMLAADYSHALPMPVAK